MDITIEPGKLSGTIAAIPSKSQAHRLLICAAFADKQTALICPDTNRDIEATADCLNALGAKITRTSSGYDIIPISQIPQTAILNCCESGSTLRFMLPIVGALGVDGTFTMEGRLADLDHTLGDLHACKRGASFKRMSRNCGQHIGKNRRLQSRTFVEHVFAHGRNGIRQGDLGKRGTTAENAVAEGTYAPFERHGPQRGTAAEGRLADLAYGSGDRDLSKGGAVLKSIVTDLLHTVADGNRGKGGAV